MAEYEVDVFIYCENPDCEYSPDEPDCVRGDDARPNEWICPECGTHYEFEIEFEPVIAGQREKRG